VRRQPSMSKQNDKRMKDKRIQPSAACPSFVCPHSPVSFRSRALIRRGISSPRWKWRSGRLRIVWSNGRRPCGGFSGRVGERTAPFKVQSSEMANRTGLGLDGVLSLTLSGFGTFRAGGKVMGGRVLVRHSKAVEGWRPQPHSRTLARGSGSSVVSQRRLGVLRCGEFLRPFFTSHLLPAPLTPEPGEGNGKSSGVKVEAVGELRSDPVPGSKAGRLERPPEYRKPACVAFRRCAPWAPPDGGTLNRGIQSTLREPV
jgi:hypothetical protein